MHDKFWNIKKGAIGTNPRSLPQYDVKIILGDFNNHRISSDSEGQFASYFATPLRFDYANMGRAVGTVLEGKMGYMLAVKSDYSRKESEDSSPELGCFFIYVYKSFPKPKAICF